MPTKVVYEAFDTDPSLEFDHHLAEKLGWRSVDRMRREMSADEWLRWSIYYQRKAQRIELQAAKGE